MFLICFGSFTWALQGGFFTSDRERNFGITATRAFGLIFMLLHLWALIFMPSSQPLLSNLGILLYVAALLLFWSAIAVNWKRPLALAFTSKPPHHLTAGGPYRWVRHPFYTSYFIGWVAGGIATENPWTLLALPVMGFLYVVAALSEERLYARSSLSSGYLSYQHEVGMFFPKASTLFAGRSGFRKGSQSESKGKEDVK